MTYAELFAAVSALLPTQSFSIQVNTWLHRHGAGRDNVETEWTVYTSHVGHCEGKTPEEALAVLREKLSLQPYEAKTSQSLDDVSAAVGDASVEPVS